MTRLGYTPAMIEAAGSDAYNYQGVGCPHHHAHISPGGVLFNHSWTFFLLQETKSWTWGPAWEWTPS